MRKASIYKKTETYIIHGQSKAASGFNVASTPYFNIPLAQANTDKIVHAIKESLCNDDSKRVPDPQDFREFEKEYLKSIGVRSMKELESNSQFVLICNNGQVLTFIPSYLIGKPGKGFYFKNKSETVQIDSDASDRDIMAALTLAFDKCG